MKKFPPDFQKIIEDQLGSESMQFFSSVEAVPPNSVRLNPLKQASIEGRRIPWTQLGVYLDHRPIYTLDPSLHAGAYYVQEASSMFLEQAIHQVVDPVKDIIALDLCAAPGGKSTHLLSLLSKKSLVVCNEVIRSRVPILEENIQKWGYPNVVVTSSDPSKFSSLENVFDLIIVDAPCSGEGLFRKDPSAMDHWSLDNVKTCSLRQQRILKDIWPALKPGGILIYSTCTFNRMEDEGNMVWLTKQGSANFIKLSIDSSWNIREIQEGTSIGYKFFPHLVDGEGFFLSVVQKDSNTINPKEKNKKANLTSVAKKVEENLQSWLKSDSEINFFSHRSLIYAIPSASINRVNYLSSQLHVISAGTPWATEKNGKLIPEHAAALSVKLDHDRFQYFDLEHQDALKYLRKDALSISNAKLGFALVRYQNNALGWVNLLHNRVNNLYPSSWRIRM